MVYMIPPEVIKKLYDRLTELPPIPLKPAHRERALGEFARQVEEWELEAEEKTASILPKRVEEASARELERRIEETEHRQEQAQRQTFSRQQRFSLEQEERERQREQRELERMKTQLTRLRRAEAIPGAGELASLREEQKKEGKAQFKLKALLDKQKRIHENKSWF